MVGRGKNECFEKLGFELIKENNKYVAVCGQCGKHLQNTAAARLKGHRWDSQYILINFLFYFALKPFRNICKYQPEQDINETLMIIIDDNQQIENEPVSLFS